MIKAIIFDWDDVFVTGSKDGYFKCYFKTLELLKIPLETEEAKRRILKNWGKSHKYELSGLLKEHPERLAEACEVYENLLFNSGTFINCIKPVMSARDMLGDLSGRYKLAIATGIHPILLDQIMRKFKIPAVFSKIVSGYDIKEEKNQKPSPYMINNIIDFLGVKKNEAVYVGDAESDVLMAQNAGVIPIVVLTGHLSKKDAMELNVTHIIKDVTEIDGAVKLINSNLKI